MTRSESEANRMIEAYVFDHEKARWRAILTAPTTQRKTVRKVGMFKRIFRALFNS